MEHSTKVTKLVAFAWLVNPNAFIKAMGLNVTITRKGSKLIYETESFRVEYASETGMMVFTTLKQLGTALDFIIGFHTDNKIKFTGKYGFRVSINAHAITGKKAKELGLTKVDDIYIYTDEEITMKPTKKSAKKTYQEPIVEEMDEQISDELVKGAAEQALEEVEEAAAETKKSKKGTKTEKETSKKRKKVKTEEPEEEEEETPKKVAKSKKSSEEPTEKKPTKKVAKSEPKQVRRSAEELAEIISEVVYARADGISYTMTLDELTSYTGTKRMKGDYKEALYAQLDEYGVIMVEVGSTVAFINTEKVVKSKFSPKLKKGEFATTIKSLGK